MYIPKPTPEHTCPVCGKLFQVPNVDDWVYRKNRYNERYILCSWTCYRVVEKEMEGRVKKRGRKKRVDLCENQKAN